MYVAGGADFPGDHPPPRFDVGVLAVRIEVALCQLLRPHIDHVLEASRGKECGRLALVDSERQRLLVLLILANSFAAPRSVHVPSTTECSM